MIQTLADVPVNTMVKVYKNNIRFYTVISQPSTLRANVSYWKDGELCYGFLWSGTYILDKDFIILGTNKIIEV